MRKNQLIPIIMDKFNNEPFHFKHLSFIVKEHSESENSHALYQHLLKFVSSGICIRVARGYYALTEKGMALYLQSQRDKAANAFLEELLKQKAEQDLIQFEIKALQSKIKALKNVSYEKSAEIDVLTTQLLNVVEQDN